MSLVWRKYLRPGDWLVLVVGVAAVILMAPRFWGGGAAEKAIVRSGGKIFAELDLAATKRIEVPGPLGTTVIVVEAGRARVLSDPGPRQYCVRQGWLKRGGDIAICAPNRVSLEVVGREAAYDSLVF